VLEGLRLMGRGLVDLLYPPRCLVCDALGEPFCDGCCALVEPLEPGSPVPRVITGVHSLGYHAGPLREAVLRLKFQRKAALAAPLGKRLAQELSRDAGSWRPDALVPVPLHWTRQWERGFNQSELLADAAARELGLPVRHALRKVRSTPHQVGLTREHRAANLRAAFVADPRYPVAGQRLVLVDDVRTTGSTLAACAAALRRAGAAEVYALTVTFEP